MQLRSANSATLSATNVANHASARTPTRTPIRTLNPTIIAFDRNWNELFRKPLSQIDCMAYGVREDYGNGYRGIKINQAASRTTHRIHAWATPNLPT